MRMGHFCTRILLHLLRAAYGTQHKFAATPRDRPVIGVLLTLDLWPVSPLENVCMALVGKSLQRNNLGSYPGVKETCQPRGSQARDPLLTSPARGRPR
jgi:hypothetical protein